MMIPMRAIAMLSTVLVLIGCGDRHAVNGENPFYRRGLSQRKQGDYGRAAEAFEQCLRHSPDSHLAHLQLAMLYEDHLQDLTRAVMHYRAYLDREGDPEQAERAAGWLKRAERKLYSELAVVYGPAPASAATRARTRSDPAEEPETAGAPPAGNTVAAAPDREPDTSPDTSRIYIVRRGDSLAAIARRELGSEARWQAIFALNRDRLASPDKLKIGQRLKLPPRSPSP